jgi:hypothetical protein
MSYVALVPSESTTGQQRRLGAITKTGSGHARRLLIEAAWHYGKRPANAKERELSRPSGRIAVVPPGPRAQPRAPLDTVKTWMKGGRCETGAEYAEFVAVVEAGRCASLSEADAVRFLSAVRVMGSVPAASCCCGGWRSSAVTARRPGRSREIRSLSEMPARRSLSSWRSEPGARREDG